jgi:hypothetical protein
MGQEKRSDLKKSNLDIPTETINEFWPNLTLDNHFETSPEDYNYNCIAWAAGDNKDRWAPYKNYYWPDGFPKKDGSDIDDLQNFLDVFESFGYSRCDDGVYEAGYEKIVMYIKNRSVEHMARQKPNGNWTSKLGQFYHDIEHTSVEAVDSPYYGKEKIFLRRQIKNI